MRMNSEEIEGLIDSCTNKVVKQLRSSWPDLLKYLDHEELKGQAYLAVVEAMESYDKKVPLNYFLARCISNSLKNYIDKEAYQRSGRIDRDISDFYSLFEVDEWGIDELNLSASMSLETEELKVYKYLAEGYTLKEVADKVQLPVIRVRRIKDNIQTKIKGN